MWCGILWVHCLPLSDSGLGVFVLRLFLGLIFLHFSNKSAVLFLHIKCYTLVKQHQVERKERMWLTQGSKICCCSKSHFITQLWASTAKAGLKISLHYSLHDPFLIVRGTIILGSDLDKLPEQSSTEKHFTRIVWGLSFTSQWSILFPCT